MVLFDESERCRGVHDADLLVFPKREQIGIARHDEIHMRGQRERQDGIVISITANGLGQRRRRDNFGERLDLGGERSREVLVRTRIALNFGRCITLASSARSAGLLISVSVPSRTRLSNVWGGPCQKRPYSTTLISRITRTPFALGTCGLHLRIDFFH